MAISLPLDGAPFSPTQRVWLNDFLAGVLGLEQHTSHVRRAQPSVVVDRQHPYAAQVLNVRRLTGQDSEKDVRFVAFDLRGSGVTYSAGDALGVYPENCPELVESILAALGATGAERVTTPAGGAISAREALTTVYTITRSSHQFLALLAESATDPDEARWLRTLVEGDEAGFLEGQDVLDLLTHFPSARRPDVGELIAALSPIQPRLYSISSSPRAHPEQVHLTVGVVRYGRTGCQRVRKGVASTFLSERVRPGQQARIFVQPAHGFRLPTHGHTPIIMVGPGTGIAPFRAFLQERQALGATGNNWLVFGDQHRSCDFLYRQELEAYQHSGLLTHLDTAFSRDQAEKIYVQHRLLQNAPRVWSWLQRGAHVYVCGDARRMARDVDQALHKIVAEQGRLPEAEAKAYVAGLARAKRYQRDVY